MTGRPSVGTRHQNINVVALKREHPLVDILAASGIVLRRERPGTFRALCPFHQERTPSFWVDVRDSKNEHYWCFGCGAHGDVITFVMAGESCSFSEACEQLASGQMPGKAVFVENRDVRTARRWEELEPASAEGETLRVALEVFADALWRNQRARAYLRARGVSEDAARAQRLGYASGRDLLPHLQRAGTQRSSGRQFVEIAEDLGLLVHRRSGTGVAAGKYREFFWDRLIIPEVRSGEPIWFIGRAVEPRLPLHSGQQSNGNRPKYLSLAGQKPVLGLERVIGQPFVYAVEGPFDWLAAVGWGLPAFAICGTHFPPERLPSLAAAVAVYGVFDPDRAGRAAAERFARLFGSRWRPVRLPSGTDLADLAKLGQHGREMFWAAVARARAAAWRARA